MKALKKWWKKFRSPTPKKWKKIRNASITLLTFLGAIGGLSATVPNATTPTWFVNYAWYIGVFLLAVGIMAQSHEEPNKR